MKKLVFILLACIAFLLSCDKSVDPTPIVVVTPDHKGTLEIEFRVPLTYLPDGRVLRADLSIAKNAEELYKGQFIQTSNVYNSKLKYDFELKPGTYYYQAGIICIAGNDSCSAANFPGGKFGMKWALGTAVVKENITTFVIPQFTN